MFGGFNTGKRPYIVLSGDTTMDAFNLFHEHAHNIPQLLNAISSMLRDGWISKREYNAYKNSRKRRRAANLGIPVSEVSEESEQTIRTEFACDMLGVYAMQAFCNEDHWSAYGIDAETIGSIKQTLDEALAANAITETDAETVEREFSTLEEAGRAISEAEAKGETRFSENGYEQRSVADPLEYKGAAGDVLFTKRYEDLTSSEKAQYRSSKNGNAEEAMAFARNFITQEVIDKINSLGSDVVILPIVSENKRNQTPLALATDLATRTKATVFADIFKRAEQPSQSHSIWERMQEPYPTFDIDEDVEYNYLNGKRFFLVDDNSTTGRTFNGLARFIQNNGGEVVGYYSATVGRDSAEKMVVTDATWAAIKEEGIDNVRDFAEKNGVQRTVSRNGLSEREAEELLSHYRGDKQRTRHRSVPGSEAVHRGVQEIHRGTSGSVPSLGLTADNNTAKAPDDGAFSVSENGDIRFSENAPNAVFDSTVDEIESMLEGDFARGEPFRFSENSGNKKPNALATSPASNGLGSLAKQNNTAKQGRLVWSQNPVTSAANTLGIGLTIPQVSEDVKRALQLLELIHNAIPTRAPVNGSRKGISATRLRGILLSNGVFHSEGSNSAYLQDNEGERTIRVSDHNANAGTFMTQDNISIVIQKTGKRLGSTFRTDDSRDVAEYVFGSKYLDDNPDVFQALIRDIAGFIVNGEYKNTAGAREVHRSGNNTNRFAFSENAPTTKKQERLKKAWELFDDGATPQDYYAESGSDFDLKTNNLLRGLMLRNGENVGGALADNSMQRVTEIFSRAKKRLAAGLTLSSPVRVFEDVTGWGGSTAEERANNIKDGNFLKNTYYEYGNVQAANREAWIAEKMR